MIQKKLLTTAPVVPAPDKFDELWKLWPRGDGKLAAQRAWTKALRKGLSAETILSGARHFRMQYDGNPKPEEEKRQFCKHLSTWINGECWNDYEENDPEEEPDIASMSKQQRTDHRLREAGIKPVSILWE